MSLTTGTRIGQYEIQLLLGAGGMGEVYRATDSKLSRSVALKVIPQELAQDTGVFPVGNDVGILEAKPAQA